MKSSKVECSAVFAQPRQQVPWTRIVSGTRRVSSALPASCKAGWRSSRPHRTFPSYPGLIKPFAKKKWLQQKQPSMSSQFETKLEDIPLQLLYDLLRPITVSASSTRFNNWGRAFFCTPLAIFEPESEYQCKLILELARREGRTVRAVGVGHSPSDLACTSGYMMRLTKMNRLIQVGSTTSASSFNISLNAAGSFGSFHFARLLIIHFPFRSLQTYHGGVTWHGWCTHLIIGA